MKKWFNYFLLISLIFVIVSIIREDYLKVPVIFCYPHLLFSFLFLFAGFIFDTISWGKVINSTSYNISYKNAISSMGLSIFGKYMPGKVWVILGRGEYIVKKYQYPRKDLSSFSLNTQFISLWTGLLFGAIGMVAINGINIYGLSVLLLFIALTLIVFTPLFHRIAEKILKKILKKEISVPRLSFINAFKVLPWFILNWGFWCLSFYLLASSLVNYEISLHTAWGFGLAGSLGIMAIIAPGGIGVREGLLTGYLSLSGLDIQSATTIAVASRLWFLIGEVFIFLTAVVLDKTSKKVNAHL